MSSLLLAQRVIRDIRKSRRADEPGGLENELNAQDLVRSLRILSEQLYTSPAHFILELIQNADDNTYADGLSPRLSFAFYETGLLFISCNEIGFKVADVKAICAIGQSTKTTATNDARKGYIGEKGIGFKAVFKVADVVWVKSGHFSFKLDKNKPLGMLVPEECDFPGPALGKTSICLQIPDPKDRKVVKSDLKSLHAELLLFLRKLERIEIKLFSGLGAKEWLSHSHVIECTSHHDVDEGKSTLTRTHTIPRTSKTVADFYCYRMECVDMPWEEKREGVKATEVVLGFPISPEPSELQKVYNFLPIRKYGLTFLLQADFILTADRSNILEDNDWNEEIVSQIPEAFKKAVEVFNDTCLCKYDWPAFLSTSHERAASGTILETLIPDIIGELSHERVLETQNGTYSKPEDVSAVPLHFSDGCKPPRPLLDKPRHLRKYVSAGYDSKDLEVLGVSRQSSASFHKELKIMSPLWIRSKPARWHIRLAAGVLKAGASSFRDVPLIPLRDGTWVSADDGAFYLPSAGDDVLIPAGIDAQVIHQDACENNNRKKMFVALGAQTLTARSICDRILDLHRTMRSGTRGLSRQSLVYHAWYLFLHGGTNLDCQSLCFVTEKQKVLRGEELYLDILVGDFRMKDHFSAINAPCDFVHSDYLLMATSTQRPTWRNWLQDTAGLAVLPRLTGDKMNLSPEFKYLIEHAPSNVWLTLLRDNWSEYASVSYSLAATVRDIFVDCKQTSRSALRDTYLPTTEVVKGELASKHPFLLDVPDADNRAWNNLTILGLRVTRDLHFYLSILISICISFSPKDIDSQQLDGVYEGVSRHFEQNPESARLSFAEYRLIGLPLFRPMQWLSLSECRWKADPCLQHVISLQTHMRSHKTLLCEKLGLKSAGPGDVLKELISDGRSRTGEDVKELLLALSSYSDLGHQSLAQDLRRLASMRIFPVERDAQERRSAANLDWFIPDRPRVTRCFQGKIWLIDFTEDELRKLQPVLEETGLLSRLLSKHVHEATVADGSREFQSRPTRKLQAKSEYISLLVPEKARQDALQKLQGVQVWSSEHLRLQRSVTIAGDIIMGEEETGRVLLQVTDESIELTCDRKSFSSNDLPWHFIAQELSEYLSIGQDKQRILMSILTTSDHGLIADILERENLDAHDGLLPERHDRDFEDSDDEQRNDAPRAESGVLSVGTNPTSRDVSSPMAFTRAGRRDQATSASGLMASPSSRLQVIDPERILASAATLGADGFTIVALDTDADEHTSTASSGASVSIPATPPNANRGSGHFGSRQAWSADDSSPRHDSAFSMRTLDSALPEISPSRPQRTNASGVGSTEQEIGYGGELFIYRFLQKRILVDKHCWTSRLRSRFGLEPFTGREGSHADFTITRGGLSAAFWGWLQWQGVQDPGHFLCTYHLEVKTTIGEVTEPFMMSNNQIRLAQEWHEDPDHVYIIFRVYRLNSKPAFQMYVDPHALRLAGKLCFTAQGGYLVQPA